MKRIKTILSVLLTASIFGSMFIGCGSNNTSQGSDSAGSAPSAAEGEYDGTVNMAFSTWIGYGPLHVADKKGFFKEEGVDVKIQVIENDGDKKSAMAADKIQSSAGTVSSVMLAQGAGIDQVMVLALADSNGADGVVSQSGIGSFADLKGKQVALDTSGGASIFLFNYLLQKNGMTMNDVNALNMSPGDAGSAFVGGKVDAAVTWEPWLSNAKKTDFGKVLVSSEETPGIIVDSLSFRRDFYEKYPKTVQKIVNAWFKAVDYCKTNPDDANQIMADAMGMSKEEFEATLPTVKYYNREDNKTYFNDKKINETAQMATDLWTEMKLVNEKAEVDKYIDGQFVNAE